MTDKEIIKALECLCGYALKCRECPYSPRYPFPLCEQQVAKDTIDLITRQQAEIDKLKECPKCVYEYDGEITEYCVQGPCSNFKTVEQVKSEAYKECLAKVKNYIKTHCNPYGKPDFDYDTSIKILNFIDKLAKEMVGENNG